MKLFEGFSLRTFSQMMMVVVVIWATSGAVIYFIGDNWAERGTIGDMFGSVNALFSGLAFAALVVTIYIQREEISLHRKDLDLTRKEIQKANVVQQEFQLALQHQAEQSHLTAKLNAMNTVINYYSIQIANPNNSPELIENAKEKRKALIKHINDLISDLNDIEIE